MNAVITLIVITVLNMDNSFRMLEIEIWCSLNMIKIGLRNETVKTGRATVVSEAKSCQLDLSPWTKVLMLSRLQFAGEISLAASLEAVKSKHQI